MLPRYLTISILFTYLFFSFPQPIKAQPVDWSTSSICNDSSDPYNPNAVVDGVPTLRAIECLVYNLLQSAIYLIGIAVLVMLVVGAYQLLTSGGDPKAAEAAKNTITYSVLGLVLAISSWFILRLIANFTGALQILNFSTQVP